MMNTPSPEQPNYGEDVQMLTRVQRVNLGVEESLELCLETLKTINYQTTIFGARRLLCVKRSQKANRVVTVEIIIEAFSRYETNLTICGNLSDPCAEWEIIGEVFCIADSLSENARLRSHVHTPAAFPLNNLQVCIA